MPNVKDKMTGKTIAKMSYDNKGMEAANKMAADNPGYMVTDGSMRNETMYEGGGKTGMSMIGMPQYRKGGKLMYGHGGKTHKSKYMGGGMTKAMKKYEEGGKTLKSVDSSKNPGLAKLPKEVRNKMGYMKEGGKTFVEKIKQKRAERKAKREAGEGRRVGRKFVKKNMAAEAAGKPVDLEYLFTEGKGDGSVRDVKRGINKYKKNQRKRNRLAQKKNKKK